MKLAQHSFLVLLNATIDHPVLLEMCIMSTHLCKLFLLIVVSVFLIVEGGFFFEQIDAEISLKGVSERRTESSPISCLLQCMREEDCHMAALTDSECLFLKSKNISKGEENEDEVLEVKLLKQIEPRKNTSGLHLIHIDICIDVWVQFLNCVKL